MEELPECDAVFERFIAPQYSEEYRREGSHTYLRGDVETGTVPIGKKPSEISPLEPSWQKTVTDQIQTMVDAACSDFAELLDVPSKPSVQMIVAFDNHYDRQGIQDLMDESSEEIPDNPMFITCIEFAMILGEVLKQLLPRLEWVPEWPYWESYIYDPDSGSRVNVFDWAVKKMSEYGVDDGYEGKLHTCVGVLRDSESE